MPGDDSTQVRIKVVGVGGAGGNAIARMAASGLHCVEILAVNTDVQALGRLTRIPTFAIGPNTTAGMGSGGDPDIGRRAMKESQGQVAQLLEGLDLLFIAAGLGGGTGTGAAPILADVARRQGILTVAVVSRPFSFEGQHRLDIASRGQDQLTQKVDTIIAVDNDRLLPPMGATASLEKAFKLADEVLRQGVQGISEIVTVPGLVNVDFADLRAVMKGGGPSFMAMGEGKGKRAAVGAARAALATPLFDAPVRGAQGILLNVRGGSDLALEEVHEVADLVREASGRQANVIFGVVQQRGWKKRAAVTLVATGLAPADSTPEPTDRSDAEVPAVASRGVSSNGHRPQATAGHRLL